MGFLLFVSCSTLRHDQRAFCFGLKRWMIISKTVGARDLET